MLNRTPPRGERAILRYEDAEYTILKPGRYVICAVSGEPIPLEELRYWNVDLQEAYRSVHEAQTRWRALQEEQRA
jgi:hypothetical protein